MKVTNKTKNKKLFTMAVAPKDAPRPRLKRAAQFAPFAALTGYEAIIAAQEQTCEEKKPKRTKAETADADFLYLWEI